MRFWLILTLLLLSVSKGISQTIISDIQYIPPTFFVGDLVDMRVQLTGGPLSGLSVPDNLPKAEWMDIRDIRLEVSETSTTVVISFTSFAPGVRTLPSINMGSMVLENIKISTSSILNSTYDGVRRLRGQLALPGTRFALAVILSLTAMAPFIFYRIIRLALFGIWFVSSRFLIHRPSRHFDHLVKKLKRSIGAESVSQWLTQFTDGMRIYLSDKTQCDFRSATTVEIERMLGYPEKNTPQRTFVNVLKEADMVKYAGQQANDFRLKRILYYVQVAVDRWEEKK